MQKHPRLRTLFLLCGIAAAWLAAAVIYSVGPTAVEATLQGTLPPERIERAAEALRGAVLAATLASLLLIIPVSLWVGGFAQRPLRALRVAIGHRAPVSRAWGVAEITALAATISRLLNEHRRTMSTVTRERDELAVLIDSVGEGILQVGTDGRIIRVNQTAREMLGLPERLARPPVSTLIRNAGLRALLDVACRGQTPEPIELTLDGRRLLAVSHPLGEAENDEHGVGAIAVLVDLTQVRRLEGVRRDFVANASHELKTPLTSIRGYAETLLSDDDMPEPTRRQFLETIHDNADRLQHIVEDLLDLSRLESGGWRPDIQELDMAGAAEDAWKGLRDKAAAKRIAFAIESGPGIRAMADPVAVRQILANLLDNAIRHTPEQGRIAVQISTSAEPPRHSRRNGAATAAAGTPITPLLANRRVDAEHDRPWTLTEIIDTGTGIPRDALPRVFERFYRVDPARSRAEGGTGLGLAIVKHLVESMGGDVIAESELGKGTTFRFWLPATTRTPAELTAHSAHSRASA